MRELISRLRDPGSPYGRGDWRIGRLWARADKRPLVWIVLAVVLCAAVSWRWPSPGYRYRVGDVAATDIRSPRLLSWVDAAATDESRRRARANIPKVYVAKRHEAEMDSAKRLDAVFSAIERAADLVPQGVGASESELAETESAVGPVVEELRRAWLAIDEAFRPDYDTFANVVAMPPEHRQALKAACNGAMSRAVELLELRSDEGTDREAQLSQTLLLWVRRRVVPLPEEKWATHALVDLCTGCIVPNLEYDAETTATKQTEAAASVRPVTRTVQQGQLIVARGATITLGALEDLRQLGLIAEEARDTSAAWLAVGHILVALVLAGIVLRVHAPESIRDGRRLVVFAGLLAAAAICLNPVAARPYLPQVALALAEAVGLAAGLLLGPCTAVVQAAMLFLVVGLIAQSPSLAALLAVPVGATAAMVVARRLTRGLVQVLLLGVAAGLFGATALSGTRAFELAASGRLAELLGSEFWAAARWAFVAGLGGVLAGHALTRYLEHPLHTVTHARLVELSDPNHPLLEQLLTKAPGTYHGSLVVSNVAGEAARAIGRDDDVLLVRVGALYHDIGKSVRPHMFTENQAGGHNPHDAISPMLSVRSIISHVHDGVELALKYNLPRPVIDCIREHHGSTFVSFFYKRAREMGLDDLPEAQFRYPGPKPHSATTGILMLADSAEAAVRSLHNPSHGTIEATVRKIVSDRLQAGELDECPLTIKEIKQIEQSLIKTLTSVYHGRLEYPEGDRAQPPNAGGTMPPDSPAEPPARTEGGVA